MQKLKKNILGGFFDGRFDKATMPEIVGQLGHGSIKNDIQYMHPNLDEVRRKAEYLQNCRELIYMEEKAVGGEKSWVKQKR